jgi:hypothetical protein
VNQKQAVRKYGFSSDKDYKIVGYDSNLEEISRIVKGSLLIHEMDGELSYSDGIMCPQGRVNDAEEEVLYGLLPSADHRKIIGVEIYKENRDEIISFLRDEIRKEPKLVKFLYPEKQVFRHVYMPRTREEIQQVRIENGWLIVGPKQKFRVSSILGRTIHAIFPLDEEKEYYFADFSMDTAVWKEMSADPEFMELFNHSRAWSGTFNRITLYGNSEKVKIMRVTFNCNAVCMDDMYDMDDRDTIDNIDDMYMSTVYVELENGKVFGGQYLDKLYDGETKIESTKVQYNLSYGFSSETHIKREEPTLYEISSREASKILKTDRWWTYLINCDGVVYHNVSVTTDGVHIIERVGTIPKRKLEDVCKIDVPFKRDKECLAIQNEHVVRLKQFLKMEEI